MTCNGNHSAHGNISTQWQSTIYTSVTEQNLFCSKFCRAPPTRRIVKSFPFYSLWKYNFILWTLPTKHLSNYEIFFFKHFKSSSPSPDTDTPAWASCACPSSSHLPGEVLLSTTTSGEGGETTPLVFQALIAQRLSFPPHKATAPLPILVRTKPQHPARWRVEFPEAVCSPSPMMKTSEGSQKEGRGLSSMPSMENPGSPSSKPLSIPWQQSLRCSLVNSLPHHLWAWLSTHGSLPAYNSRGCRVVGMKGPQNHPFSSRDN